VSKDEQFYKELEKHFFGFCFGVAECAAAQLWPWRLIRDQKSKAEKILRKGSKPV
jgi:hypothetical protein